MDYIQTVSVDVEHENGDQPFFPLILFIDNKMKA